MIQNNFIFILVFIFLSSSFFNLCLSRTFNANKIEELSGGNYNYHYSIKSIIHDGKVMLYNNLKTISKYIESENQKKENYDFQFASNFPPIVYYSDSQNSIYCNNQKFIDIYPLDYKPNSFPSISCDSFVSISSINNSNNGFLLKIQMVFIFYILQIQTMFHIKLFQNQLVILWDIIYLEIISVVITQHIKFIKSILIIFL